MLGIELKAQDTAQRDRDIVVGRTRAIGPRGAEPRDRAVDQPGIGGAEDIVRQSELLHDAGPIILEQDVGAREEPQHDGSARFGAQVELNAALAAVVCDEVRAVLPAPETPERVALRGFDLDHVGAEIGQHQPRERCRDHRAELDDAHACQHIRHCTQLRPCCRYSAACVCIPAYSLSVSDCRVGSTSLANNRMFFSVRSRGRVANCSSARKFWKPSSR